MNLKQLRLKKQIDLKKAELLGINNDLETIKRRSQEIEKTIEEVEPNDDLMLVDDEVEKLTKENEEKETIKKTLEEEIETLENELTKTNEKQKQAEENKTAKEERTMGVIMNTRNKYIDLVRNENVNNYLVNLKTAAEKRSALEVDLTIPDELFDIVMDEVGKKSKLYNLVNVKKLTGKGRALIIAEAAQAIWVEQVGALKELSGTMSQIEVDGYKVGGYIALHNSQIEDSVVNLLQLVVDLLSDGIAKAIDAAILFGDGEKMPEGIWSKIVGNGNDVNSNPTFREQVVKAHTPKTMLVDIVKGCGNIKYTNGPRTVVMNETTWYNQILASTVNANSAGQLVAAQSGKFPILNYDVVLMSGVPENVIFIGDFKKYVLAQRSGLEVNTSTEVKFIEDQTLIKATQRFDGKVFNLAGFIIVTLDGNTNSTIETFGEKPRTE